MVRYELYHVGVKGQKWGVRLYQNKDGSLTALGKLRYRKEAKKAAKQQKELENTEAKKKRILESRSAKDLYENAHLFTDKELSNAYNRLQTERNIANLKNTEVNKGKKFVNDVIKVTQTTSNLIESGGKLYNNVARVYNAFFADSSHPGVPTIDINGQFHRVSKKQNSNNG